MNIKDAVGYLDGLIVDAKEGLPEEVFLFACRITPMVNVDMLVKDEKGRTLLSWRDDVSSGKGWHVPGGIVRYKESFEDRLRRASVKEFGAEVEFDPVPVALNQFFRENNERGHFISLLFNCRLPAGFDPDGLGLTENKPGFLKWFEKCPEDLIGTHSIYRRYINGGYKGVFHFGS